MQLVVGMPTFNTPAPLLKRAVESVLAQTLEDLALVVVNDGGEPLTALPRDDRLIVHELPENRGRYYADAVVVHAISARPDTFWSPHDADDWSEPERFEKLLPAALDGAAVAPYWRHVPRRPDAVQQPRRDAIAQPSHRFAHLVHWSSGAYTVERLERAGGLHPGFRIGFDTLHTLMIALTGPVAVHDEARFHWCRRLSGSLTSDPATRLGSRPRSQVRIRLRKLYQHAWQARERDPGNAIRNDVPAGLREQVVAEGERLREELG